MGTIVNLFEITEGLQKRGPRQKYSEEAILHDVATHLFHQRIEYMQTQWDEHLDNVGGDLAPTARRYNTYEEFMKGAPWLASTGESSRLHDFLMKMHPVLNKMWEQYVEGL